MCREAHGLYFSMVSTIIDYFPGHYGSTEEGLTQLYMRVSYPQKMVCFFNKEK